MTYCDVRHLSVSYYSDVFSVGACVLDFCVSRVLTNTAGARMQPWLLGVYIAVVKICIFVSCKRSAPRHRVTSKTTCLVFKVFTGFCITGYASFHPGGVTCDVNAAARLIDLTACMYVPAPCWAVRATVAAVAGERGAAHAHVHVCCGFLPNSL